MEQTELIYEKCDALLMAMLGRQDLVERWWHSPNRGFDMAYPAEVEPRKVLQYLMSKAEGEW